MSCRRYLPAAAKAARPSQKRHYRLLFATLCVLGAACTQAASRAEATTVPAATPATPRPNAPAPTSSNAHPAPAPAPVPSGAAAAPEPTALPKVPVEVPPDMALVPGGSFLMGADKEGEMDERPTHRVTLHGFLLDLTEVTNQAYQVCVDARVCRPASRLEDSHLTNGMPEVFRRPTHPVAGVSWDDAKQYCTWKQRRLPTEAEWERAARADDNRRYVWGNAEPDAKTHGVFGGKATTEPVAGYPGGKSAYGQFDMAGNVWEWVADDYDPFAYQRESAASGRPGSCEQILAAQDQLRREHKQGYTGTNPIPSECEKVLRGGAYNYRVGGLRNSNRVHHPARFRIAVAGFRCAKDLPSDGAEPPNPNQAPGTSSTK